MRKVMAELIELAGLSAVTAGVYLLLGTGAALIMGGVLAVAAALAVERAA